MSRLGLWLVLALGCGRSPVAGLELPAAEEPSPPPVGTICDARLAPTLRALPEAQMMGAVRADGDTVVFEAEGGIFRVNLARNEEAERVTELDLTLLDAEGGLVLAGERSHRVVFGTRSMSQVVDMTPREHMVPGRYIAGRVIAGCASEFSIGALDLDSGARFETLLPTACREPFLVDRRDVLYEGRVGGRRGLRLVHWRVDFNSRNPEIIAELGELGSPALFRGRAFVLDGGAVRAIELDGSRRSELIHSGPCVELSAGEAGLAMLCDPAEVEVGLAIGKTLLMFDGSSTRFVDTQARAVVSPRVGARVVAWLAYDDPSTFCRGAEEAGHVMAAPFDGGALIEVARIGVGCFCCGAFWPPPMLEVDGDTLAFNYDARRLERRPEGSIAAARLKTICD